MSCALCYRDLKEDETVLIKKPYTIRGLKAGSTKSVKYPVQLCSYECRKIYIKQNLCSVCLCDYEMEEICYPFNKVKVCKPNEDDTDHPNCKEEYTNIFTCDVCKHRRDTDKVQCNIIKDYYDITYYICTECSYNIDNSEDDRWKNIKKTDSCYNNMISLLTSNKNNKLQKNISNYICNKCNNIKNVYDGINIEDDMNICNECILIKN